MRKSVFISWFFVLVVGFFTAFPAFAQVSSGMRIATVDFQRAINEVDEGVRAQARLEGMREEKLKSIERQRTALVNMQNELINQSAILSESARSQKEQAFAQAQAQFQQTAMASEQELQQTYMTMVDDLVKKMQVIAASLGQERGYSLVLEATESGIVYANGVDDLTAEVIQRFNAAHKSTP